MYLFWLKPIRDINCRIAPPRTRKPALHSTLVCSRYYKQVSKLANVTPNTWQRCLKRRHRTQIFGNKFRIFEVRWAWMDFGTYNIIWLFCYLISLSIEASLFPAWYRLVRVSLFRQNPSCLGSYSKSIPLGPQRTQKSRSCGIWVCGKVQKLVYLEILAEFALLILHGASTIAWSVCVLCHLSTYCKIQQGRT